MLGVFLRGRPLAEVTRPASRGIAIGLAISLITGLLLFAPRAVAASQNSTFQIKMLLLVTAASLQFALHGRVARPIPPSGAFLRLAGGAGMALWLALAVAACAFILLE
jgi:hypothetical protein